MAQIKDVCNVHIAQCRPPVPAFRSSVWFKYAKVGYHYLISNTMCLLIVPFIGAALVQFDEHRTNMWDNLRFDILTGVLSFSLSVLLAMAYNMSRPRAVYLVNFSCYKPDPAWKCTKEMLLETCKQSCSISEENIGFMRRILERSGLGQDTYLPKALHRIPPNYGIAENRNDAQVIIFGTIDELLAKTRVEARDIGILVVNCSVFNPTPSLSAMIVNHYKLRGSVVCYNLSGMGCSAGLISIDLAKRLLQVHSNSYALVVSMESINTSYLGNERSMLISNSLFRAGGTAILLSNRSSDRRRSKYQLIHTIRTHTGSDDRSYKCVFQREDDSKRTSIALSKELMAVAGEALKANITTLGPLVLPISEQLLFLASFIARKVFKMNTKAYIPDFKLVFEHFCIHAGGRAVLDEVEKNLKLTEWHMEPSRMTLYRFGNTSSSSPWYELAYSEAKGRIRKGDRIWQIGFGSGFKCNSAVWKALGNIIPAEKNPWMDEISGFPVHVPKIVSMSESK
ncbi:hypothetical protein SAY87_002797 [Trapa incisa]|uniref:3-ketoacyl-CoA synthase n=1 Tax=Trapa incisa TaxID=236973 RepID=A0AAN7JUI5_9MYRT|nr:hypothetical protein SAY87_002797 [Trapa incisa]